MLCVQLRKKQEPNGQSGGEGDGGGGGGVMSLQTKGHGGRAVGGLQILCCERSEGSAEF